MNPEVCPKCDQVEPFTWLPHRCEGKPRPTSTVIPSVMNWEEWMAHGGFRYD